MKKNILILSFIITAISLTACTQNSALPTESDAKTEGSAQQSQPVISHQAQADKMDTSQTVKSIPPNPSLPPTLDKSSQDEIKELDKMMEGFTTDTYSSQDLDSVE